MAVSPTSRRVAWGLSLAGLIPFAGLTLFLYIWPDIIQRGFAALALATYGAVILSFLGGVRWGAALDRSEPASIFALSMVPPLLGWFALALPLPLPFAVQAIGFALHGVWDWQAGRAGALPDWFVNLRVILSAFVTACLILATTATLGGFA